jgi:phosphomannomutase
MAGIFKAYDIRGTTPEQINEETARRVGFAFATYLSSKRIVVGHDMRDSSPALHRAFVEGLLAAGAEAMDIGLSTTPMLYAAIIDGAFDGGAMITASHLPARYNGVKLCREKAIPLSGDEGLPEVEALFRKADTIPPARGTADRLDFLGRYVDKVAALLDPPATVKFVIDAGNGMAGLDTLRVFERFPGCEIVSMYMEPDGDFPNHVPNPILPETTVELQKRVVEEDADFGVAFDGDADRCGFIDENGDRVPSDLVIGILAEYYLQRSPGATILYDLRSSRAVAERIEALGGVPMKTRVGHSFVKRRMREVDAVFAGELSGHYYYRDMGYIDSGILSLVSLLDLLRMRGGPVSAMVRPLQKYARSGEINFHVQDASRLLQALESAYSGGRADHRDGLTVEYPDWWFNVRQSHTEPAVRLVMEANDADVLEREKAKLERLMNKYTTRS